MFPWLPYILGAYLCLLLAGLIMCVVIRAPSRRRYIRIGTAVFSIPLWVALAGCVWVWYNFFREPPSLAELRGDFTSKQADLEAILRMSNEDHDYSRIAPDFLDRTPDRQGESGRYLKGDPNAKLPKDRWDAYRKIYRRNGIELGIQRNSSSDAFIMVRSVGFLDQGHASGYLYCSSGVDSDTYRFEPCTLHQDRGERKYDGVQAGYSFQQIADHWFAYDQGPG